MLTVTKIWGIGKILRNYTARHPTYSHIHNRRPVTLKSHDVFMCLHGGTHELPIKWPIFLPVYRCYLSHLILLYQPQLITQRQCEVLRRKHNPESRYTDWLLILENTYI